MATATSCLKPRQPSVAAIASLGLLAIPAGSSGELRYGIPLDRVYAHD
jgi:hypothetical protein